eukprot:CAMPEP_0114484592 /NCGR_PEP_ID=MMETSP0104-20121206/19502_1 /TAXON_ID=37642 ORGANISM="Paraphysomonas imperforata, Strain PA2" /NCGR_SAMPLE_ID=MMETSP0104 /ASSEMBLY_ACC=CAM_ASM_000202 /LENGTH=122 /DNA_ID=CAMNT_0001660663 /DNA_START=73 /DNA_END=441 /DNA_ORIENTATION=+
MASTSLLMAEVVPLPVNSTISRAALPVIFALTPSATSSRLMTTSGGSGVCVAIRSKHLIGYKTLQVAQTASTGCPVCIDHELVIREGASEWHTLPYLVTPQVLQQGVSLSATTISRGGRRDK